MLFSKRILFRYLCNIKKSRIRRRHDKNNLISEAIGIGCGGGSILGKRKRVDSKDNEVVKKQKVTGNYGGVDRSDEIDRISELPESIIHHIFSFFPCTKDMVRTTVLSRNWKRMFNSYNSFDFDEKWFGGNRGIGKLDQKEKFCSYVEKSIATRLEPLVSINKFRLYLSHVDFSLVHSWVRTAIDKKVKELDIQSHKDHVFVMPLNLVDFPSMISLKLSGRILHSFFVRKLSNLRELSIKRGEFFDAYTMRKVEETCPLLEDLRLVCCPELKYLSISSLDKLRRVEIQDCASLIRIEIASPIHLESFGYHSKRNQGCKFDLRNTENLKILKLKDRKMSDFLFEDWIFRCPLLEKLVLHDCTRLEKIKISSEKLKSLVLIKCVKLSEVSIDAPNLYSLEYSGHTMPFHSMNASRLCHMKLSFLPMPKKKPLPLWNFGYQNFFGDFDQFKGLKLIVYSKLNMKIFEDPREAPEDEYNMQKLEMAASSTSVLKTVDNWLRECHGKSLALISSNDELMKLISGMIMDREDNPSCCRYYSNKCWRHYIAHVEVSTSEIGSKTYYDFTWRSKRI